MSIFLCCPSSISSAVLPTLQCGLKDGFVEAIMACDMLEPFDSFCLLTVARGGSWGPTGMLISLCSQSSVFCSEKDMTENFLRQLISVQTDQMGHQGDRTDDSADIVFHCFLQEAIVSSSGMGRHVHSLMLSLQHFLCRPQRRPSSKVP